MTRVTHGLTCDRCGFFATENEEGFYHFAVVADEPGESNEKRYWLCSYCLATFRDWITNHA